MTAPPIARLPWRKILIFVICALVVSWGVGFVAGLIVRFVIGGW
jgi:hypothetical protein